IEITDRLQSGAGHTHGTCDTIILRKFSVSAGSESSTQGQNFPGFNVENNGRPFNLRPTCQPVSTVLLRRQDDGIPRLQRAKNSAVAAEYRCGFAAGELPLRTSRNF